MQEQPLKKARFEPVGSETAKPLAKLLTHALACGFCKGFKLLFIFFIAGMPLFIGGCASTTVIEEDLSPALLIQRAQEATDRGRHDAALRYYEALLERYSHRMDLVITAKYEIAFIHYRQGDFQTAREGFNEILGHFEAPGGEWLPPQFRRLSEIVLARIDEHEANPPRRLFGFLRN